jgi:hypothetical protein
VGPHGPAPVVGSTVVTLAHDGLPGDAAAGSIGGPSLAKRLPPMPTTSLPCSLADLLKVLRPASPPRPSARSRRWWAGSSPSPGCALSPASSSAPGWPGAGTTRGRTASFAAARWSADQLGLLVCDLIVGVLLSPDAPIRLVADDSLFKRTGRKIHGAGWRYDPTATGRTRTAWGNTWVVVGVLVALPLVPHRRVCLPVGARLWQPGGPSKLDLATCWSGCWPPAIPTASSTWPVTRPTPARRCAGCPSGSASPPGCAATPQAG